jgi:high-affinity nickel-transport protein
MLGKRMPASLPLRLFDDAANRLRPKATLLLLVLAAANLAAWGWAFATFHGSPLLIGTALLAYGFGLRHAVDADHIAAIDNVTRKMIQEGKRPIGVGFFFSLGHSTVVVLASVAIALSAHSLRDRFPDLVEAGSVLGTSVSALFLLVIAAVNLVILAGVWRLLRRGGSDAAALEGLLAGRGLVARLLRRLFRLVSRSWHMYPLGFLFGLGFDTATEIGLLGISAAEATKGLSVASLLIFPVLFTAGMSLVDTGDGIVMMGAYRWALVNPIRKLYYNLAVTLLSVVVAVVVGGVEALGLIAEKLDLTGGVWDAVDWAAGNFTVVGYLVVGLFLAGWLASVLIHRTSGWQAR